MKLCIQNIKPLAFIFVWARLDMGDSRVSSRSLISVKENVNFKGGTCGERRDFGRY